MASTELDFDNSDLTAALGVVRRRVTINQWLRVWFLSSDYLLAALAVAVVVASSVRRSLLAASVALAFSATFVAVLAWWRRPSPYALAQQLDQKSQSRDRISTAVHFWHAPNPSEAVLQQRADAIAHLAKLSVSDLFPLQMPPRIWRTCALLAGVFALCAYHAAFGPPLSALKQLKETVAKSQVLAGILAPVSRTIEIARSEKNGLLSFVSGEERHVEPNGSKSEASSTSPNQFNGSAQAATDSRNLDMSQAMQMASSAGGQRGQPSNQMPTEQTPDAQAASQSNTSAAQQASQQAGNGQGSIAEKALQALENLMSGASGGQQGEQTSASAQPPTAAGTTSAQSMSAGSQSAPSATQPVQGQTSNSQNAQNSASPGPGKHTGAGNGSTPWEPRDGRDPQAAAAEMAQERVVLQANGFRGAPGRERTDVSPGTAQTPLQNVAPLAVATVNGAGQDQVPPRYRTFLKNYFQRAEKQ